MSDSLIDRQLARLSPRLAAARAPTVFLDQLAHRLNFQREAGDDAVFALALVFELFETNQIARLQPRIARSPRADRVGMHAVLVAQLRRRRASLQLL